MKHVFTLLPLVLLLSGVHTARAQCPGTQPFGLGPDTTVCSNGEIELTPGPDFATYLWNDGSTSEFLTVSDSGTYFVQCFDTNGCDYYDTIFVGMVITIPLDLNPVSSVILCPGDTVIFSISNTASYAAFLWDDGTTASVHSYSTAGSYFVVGIMPELCRDTAFFFVQDDPVPPPSLATTQYFCAGDTLNINASGPGYATYFWSNGTLGPVLSTDSAGFYTLAVTDTNGCLMLDTIAVFTYPAGSVNIGADITVCDDDPAPVLSAGSGWSSYLWNTSATTSAITVTASGAYQVAVSDSNGCTIQSNSVTVTINTSPAAFTITQNASGLSVPSVAGYSYQWFENGVAISGATTSTLTPFSNEAAYSCIITSPEGCTTSSPDFIPDGGLDNLPQGISPNGDGLNDVFRIPGLSLYPDHKLTIFNRYGSEVFTAAPYNSDWDGDDLPDGTYFWLLELGGETGTRSGYIIINR